MRFLPALLAALLLVLPRPAAAYGVLGHETIAAIALRNADPRTAREVRALLARAPLLETPTCAAATPAKASVWPDCIRNLSARFSYTSPWHYQNVDVCRPFDLKSACRDGNCVSAQIDRQVKLIQDRTVPRREKVAALAYLIHFVGDLHMPLHAGDRGDRGGNDVKAAYGVYAPDWLNLHGIWDTPLADRAVTTPPALVRAYPPAERASLAAGTTEDWSREAWAVSRDTAYRLALGDPCGPKPTARVQLDEAAIQAAIEPQRLQVTRAGLRLARLLDEAFGAGRLEAPRRKTRPSPAGGTLVPTDDAALPRRSPG